MPGRDRPASSPSNAAPLLDFEQERRRLVDRVKEKRTIALQHVEQVKHYAQPENLPDLLADLFVDQADFFSAVADLHDLILRQGADLKTAKGASLDEHKVTQAHLNELATYVRDRVAEAIQEAGGAHTVAREALTTLRTLDVRHEERHREMCNALLALKAAHDRDCQDRAERDAKLVLDLARLQRQDSLHDDALAVSREDVTVLKKKLTGREIAAYVGAVSITIGLVEALLWLLRH